MSKLVQDLLHETFPRSYGVRWIPLKPGPQPMQRRNASRAAKLSGSENMGKYGQEEIDLCDADSVNTFLQRNIEKLLEQRRREVLPPPAVESHLGIDLPRRDPDRMRQVPGKVLPQISQHSGKHRANAYELHGPRTRH